MDVWTIKGIEDRLREEKLAEGREVSNLGGWIWEEVFSFPKNSHQRIDESFLNQILERIRNGEPIQYIAGHAWFYGMKFKVSPAVLIPRPETEELVEWIYEDWKNSSKPLRILDIGTGSGCIAITLKSLLQDQAEIVAIDISEEALQIAKANEIALHQEVEFIQHDFLEKGFDGLGGFDIIVSNPPYISQVHTTQEVLSNLKFEPESALFPKGNDANIFYRKIAAEGKSALQATGACYVELNEFNAEEIKSIFEKAGWGKVEIRMDLQGKPRMLKASLSLSVD
jgi:release factor glutamine methyltransferase